MANTPTRLAVLGAGPGGYAAAFLGADLGLQVTLIDREPNPGGVCLYRGCIPSKALLHVARVVNEAAQAGRWGVHYAKPDIQLDRLRGWKNEVVQKMTGGLGVLSRQRRIRYIQGEASIVDPTTFRVQPSGKGDSAAEDVAFDYAILATGSRPAAVPSLSIDSPRLLDSTSALELDDVPRSLLVVGGGYIGLELGTVYATLGTEVTVVEMTAGLLPGADRDLVAVLARRVEKMCRAVMLDTRVAGVTDTGSSLRVRLEGEQVETPEQDFEKVLVSVGRRPNSAIPGLDRTRVEVDARGFIKVDAQRRTTEPTIFAIGDVAGEPMLAHKASHEGRVAVEVIAGHNVAFEPRAIPAVVFTDPELAWCGLTESQAAAANQPVQIAKFPWGASGRATTIDRPDGLTKLVIDPASERVLGMGIVGVGAGELIAEGALALELGAVARDLALTIHPHPTLSETPMEAAEVFFGQATHYYKPRRG
jgi:dihydrolipoamide dehydrogenase